MSDVALALYPIKIVWNLQIRFRTKIGPCVLLGFGVLAAACASIKTSQLYVLNNIASISYSVVSLTEQWISSLSHASHPRDPPLRLS